MTVEHVELGVGQVDITWQEEKVEAASDARQQLIKTKNRRAEHMIGMPRDDDDHTLRAALQADYPLIKEGIRD